MCDGGANKPADNAEDKALEGAAHVPEAKAEAGPRVFNSEGLRKQHKEKKPGNRRWVTLIALVLCAGLVAGGAYLAQNVKPEPPPEPTAAPVALEKLIDMKRADLQEATVTIGNESYTIETLADGAYGMKGAPDFTLIQSKASALASSLTYMLYDSAIEAPEDLSAYGLAEPKARVTAAYTDGTSRTFLLGDQSPTGYRYYLMEEGDPDVYIVYSSVGTNFTVTRRQMHVAQLPQLGLENILSVSLTPRGKDTVEAGYRSDLQSLGISILWLTSPVVYEADSVRIETYFTDITNIRLKGFEADAQAGELSRFGLDDPRYHLTVMGQDAAGSPVTALELLIGDDKDGESTYARIDNTSDVYLLSRASLAFLADISAARLIDRFANIVNIAYVDGIQVIQPDGKSHEFAIARAPEFDAAGNPKLNANGQPVLSERFTLDGKPAPDTPFRKLYQVVIGTRVDGMIPEGSAPAEDARPVLTVKYQLNIPRDEEIIEYLPYDADHYAVRRGGVCMFYILKTRVDSISQAIQAYEDGTFDPKAFGV